MTVLNVQGADARTPHPAVLTASLVKGFFYETVTRSHEYDSKGCTRLDYRQRTNSERLLNENPLTQEEALIVRMSATELLSNVPEQELSGHRRYAKKSFVACTLCRHRSDPPDFTTRSVQI